MSDILLQITMINNKSCQFDNSFRDLIQRKRLLSFYLSRTILVILLRTNKSITKSNKHTVISSKSIMNIKE